MRWIPVVEGPNGRDVHLENLGQTADRQDLIFLHNRGEKGQEGRHFVHAMSINKMEREEGVTIPMIIRTGDDLSLNGDRAYGGDNLVTFTIASGGHTSVPKVFAGSVTTVGKYGRGQRGRQSRRIRVHGRVLGYGRRQEAHASLLRRRADWHSSTRHTDGRTQQVNHGLRELAVVGVARRRSRSRSCGGRGCSCHWGRRRRRRGRLSLRGVVQGRCSGSIQGRAEIGIILQETEELLLVRTRSKQPTKHLQTRQTRFCYPTNAIFGETNRKIFWRDESRNMSVSQSLITKLSREPDTTRHITMSGTTCSKFRPTYRRCSKCSHRNSEIYEPKRGVGNPRLESRSYVTRTNPDTDKNYAHENLAKVGLIRLVRIILNGFTSRKYEYGSNPESGLFLHPHCLDSVVQKDDSEYRKVRPRAFLCGSVSECSSRIRKNTRHLSRPVHDSLSGYGPRSHTENRDLVFSKLHSLFGNTESHPYSGLRSRIRT